jgi:CRP-like cAMP-binding protein
MSDIQRVIRSFFSKYREVSFGKGETILGPGDPVSYVWLIRSGYIRMYNLLPDGKEFTVNIFKPDSYFPMFLILGGSGNTYYYQTITPTVCVRAPESDVRKFLHANPDALIELTGRISRGFDGLLSNIPHLLFGPATSRVTAALIMLAGRFGEIQDTRIIIQLPLTHQDIANLVGMTRETTSIEMEKLVKKGVVSYQRQLVTVNDLQTLQREVFMDENTHNLQSSI